MYNSLQNFVLIFNESFVANIRVIKQIAMEIFSQIFNYDLTGQ
jgi:hypothetical protein